MAGREPPGRDTSHTGNPARPDRQVRLQYTGGSNEMRARHPPAEALGSVASGTCRELRTCALGRLPPVTVPPDLTNQQLLLHTDEDTPT